LKFFFPRLLLLPVFCAALVLPWLPQRHACAEEEGDDLVSELESIRKENHLPALAAAAVCDGKIVAIGATGVRKWRESVPVTIDDSWHLGSLTKSMTATVAAMLIEQGYLDWETTVGEVFPEWADTMNPAWENVTLYELLTHRAGAPAHPPDEAWLHAWAQHGTPEEQRREFVQKIIAQPPVSPRGHKFIYSNQGYAIAGAMLEKRTGKSWETLMRTMLFMPLKMDSAGFGAPGMDNRLDQPWGHVGTARKPEPVPPGPLADNPPAIGPAGTVHCSIADLARYAAFHASMGATAPGLLSRVAFEELHARAPGEQYGCGWCVEPREWAGGDAIYHTGSNTMWYCAMWVAPEINTAFVAASNSGSELADDGCDQAIKVLLKRVLGTTNPDD
jgi:CubicO group peptidase (beta-lactamase class C family)